MENGFLESKDIVIILVGTLIGLIARFSMLKKDYRQYPTYPNGYLIHLTTGLIAAGIGAVALPALLAKNFVAVTFLALAIQQFRDIRKMERETLFSLDKNEYVPRGHAYIDGIAKTFEARNYVTMITSLTTTLVALLNQFDQLLLNIAAGIATGLVIFMGLKFFTKGSQIGDIIESIEEVELSFEKNNLMVGDIYVMNFGLEATQKRVLKEGIGMILTAKGENEAIILNQEGQQQAIIHECGRLLGVERYVTARRDFDTDRLAIFIVPIRKDPESMKQIIKQVPILESNKKNEGA